MGVQRQPAALSKLAEAVGASTLSWASIRVSGTLIPGHSYRCRVPLGTRYELRIRKAYCASLRRTRVQHLYHFVRAVVSAFSDLVPEYSFEHFGQHWYRPRCLLDAHRASLPLDSSE